MYQKAIRISRASGLTSTSALDILCEKCTRARMWKRLEDALTHAYGAAARWRMLAGYYIGKHACKIVRAIHVRVEGEAHVGDSLRSAHALRSLLAHVRRLYLEWQ